MRLALSAALLLIFTPCAIAQQFEFTPATDPAAQTQAIAQLAQRVLTTYREDERGKYLDNLFRLQIIIGRYQDAMNTIHSLRQLLRTGMPPRGAWVNTQYEIYAQAKAQQEATKGALDDAYRKAFQETFARLDNPTAALVIRSLTLIDAARTQQDLQSDLEKQKGKNKIQIADALKLLRDYQVAEAYGVSSRNQALIAEDDARRYVTEKDILVKTPDGASVCALLMRPKNTGRLPTLLNFTIYVDVGDNTDNARQSAAHGYAGVVGFTRGKACSPDKPLPYVHDGHDAAALIDWISAQPWSDGRVGMYGGSYEGFTQFAAAKYMPKALKALMPGVPAAPAIDVPMEGNIFWNFVYPWPFYTTDAKGADNATYNDVARWRKLNHDWYVSGRPYRDLDKIDGTPNPIFDQWLSHPDYDAYWQSMIPYGKEFAAIDIPLLITAGYYYGGPGAAVYYFSQLDHYSPKSEHYLLIGPYDHLGGQFGVVGLLGNLFDSVGGLPVDPVARLDMSELRYQWFDHVFKGAPKPVLLADKVNYEVTGADVWKHAPTIGRMSNGSLRFYCSAVGSGVQYHLSLDSVAYEKFIPLKVDLADRSDVDREPPSGVSDTAVDLANGIEFVSDPLPPSTEINGLFSGRLEFMSNKKDFDFEIDLYELTRRGQYIQLAPYWTRASYAEDLSHRHLLNPGRHHKLEFHSIRLMSRRLQEGSRLAAVIRIIKEPGRQINYGTGQDVSDESIQEANPPLGIKWSNASYLDIPLWK